MMSPPKFELDETNVIKGYFLVNDEMCFPVPNDEELLENVRKKEEFFNKSLGEPYSVKSETNERAKMSFNTITGIVLVLLVLFSAALAVAGIWGFIKGDTAGQLFGTFAVVAGAVLGVSYCVNTFLK